MKRKRKKTPAPLGEAMTGGSETINSDVQGSWTGNPADGGRPVQDADDL